MHVNEFANERRNFLKKSILIAASTTLCADELFENNSELVLHVSRKNSEYVIPFHRDGKIYEDGYYDLCKIFGDTHDKVTVDIDVELFKTLEFAQSWLRKYGVNKPIILNSGYRTLHTNNKTEGAARNSMHLYGKAADVRVQGISMDYLGRLLRASGGGGIGIYQSFVHVDTWKERAWRG